MAFIVEMARGEPYEPGFSSFACGAATWKGLLSIARTFGWSPAGSVRDERMARWTKDYDQHFVPNYAPEEWAYCKRISDEDAAGLSAALTRAASAVRDGQVVVLERGGGRTLLKDEMSASELRQANALPSELLDEFARFASGGGFAFAWDD